MFQLYVSPLTIKEIINANIFITNLQTFNFKINFIIWDIYDYRSRANFSITRLNTLTTEKLSTFKYSQGKYPFLDPTSQTHSCDSLQSCLSNFRAL